jgi:hypothetical protein
VDLRHADRPGTGPHRHSVLSSGPTSERDAVVFDWIRGHFGPNTTILGILPRYEFSTVPALDRVLPTAGENNAAKQQVLAAWSAIQPRQPVEDIYQNVGSGETAYDASLRDLARTRSCHPCTHHRRHPVLSRCTAGLFSGELAGQ